MKKELKVGDYYEFCVIIDKMSHVLYGKVIKINNNGTVDFMKVLNYVHSKVDTGEIYKNVVTIRGLNNFKW